VIAGILIQPDRGDHRGIVGAPFGTRDDGASAGSVSPFLSHGTQATISRDSACDRDRADSQRVRRSEEIVTERAHYCRFK
jgi:hypothetical protein